jgi:predicted nucleotidyltransferase component of viral defense system
VIPQREINAWREHAPWPDDVQVEQDLLLARCMMAIFEDGFLRENLAMRGGTALHKVHLAPAARYSEDIDLVLVHRRRQAVVEKALAKVLDPILGKPANRIVGPLVVAVRNAVSKSQIIRQTYQYRPTKAGRPMAKLKVEVNCNEHDPVYKIAEIPFTADGKLTTLRTYDIDEMLGTKMRALFQRNQSRDLFDLYWALTSERADHPVDPDRIVHAFCDYMRREGTIVSGDKFGDALTRKLRTSAFRKDMETMLRPGIRFDVDEAGQIVRDRLISKIDCVPAHAM